LTYNDFENVTPGTYKATFGFPGLSYQVSKDELQQNDARIWLGELNLAKDIIIE
jgi:hypothetical protein